jgi:putative ABC transport system ATP-binding protein
MSEILRMEGVRKWVVTGNQRTDILRGISLTVQKGEFISIVGPSGSGKSTLLNIIGLLESPSEGAFKLMGKNIARLDDNQLAPMRCHGIGFVFQTFNLLPYLTAQQNIELSLGYNRQRNARERSAQLLKQVGMTHRAQAYPTTLSGGERQRVAIARALANEPPLLLADEPTGALDTATGTQILDLLLDLHRRGSTLLLVTHAETIARRAERTLTLHDGQLI